jgi:hypothetical protein
VTQASRGRSSLRRRQWRTTAPCSHEGETMAPYKGKRGTHSFDAKEVSRGGDPDCLGLRAAGPRQVCTAERGPAPRACVRATWPAWLPGRGAARGACAADASARRAQCPWPAVVRRHTAAWWRRRVETHSGVRERGGAAQRHVPV